MKNFLKLTIVLAVLGACTPKTEAFNYGEDQCTFCKMSIVEDQYAAQTVTSKGKVFKYDDISCMIRHIHTLENTELAFRVVNNFENPQELLDVEKAFFIQSDQYASPMGGNTAAFSSVEPNETLTLYTWEQLQEIFN